MGKTPPLEDPDGSGSAPLAPGPAASLSTEQKSHVTKQSVMGGGGGSGVVVLGGARNLSPAQEDERSEGGDGMAPAPPAMALKNMRGNGGRQMETAHR